MIYEKHLIIIIIKQFLLSMFIYDIEDGKASFVHRHCQIFV